MTDLDQIIPGRNTPEYKNLLVSAGQGKLISNPTRGNEEVGVDLELLGLRKRDIDSDHPLYEYMQDAGYLESASTYDWQDFLRDRRGFTQEQIDDYNDTLAREKRQKLTTQVLGGAAALTGAIYFAPQIGAAASAGIEGAKAIGAKAVTFAKKAGGAIGDAVGIGEGAAGAEGASESGFLKDLFDNKFVGSAIEFGLPALASVFEAKQNNDLLAAMSAEFQSAQAPLVDRITESFNRNPINDIQDVLEINRGVYGETVSGTEDLARVLSQAFSEEALATAGPASEQFISSVISAANQLGVNPAEINQRLQSELFGELNAADELREGLLTRAEEEELYGRSLRDGSYYDTDMGKAALANIMRSTAGIQSSTGRDAFSETAFAGSANVSEHQGVSAFLNNFERERRYGDQVLAGADGLLTTAYTEPARIKDSVAARVGGLLVSALDTGRTAATAGFGLGESAAANGLSQAGALARTRLGNDLVSPTALSEIDLRQADLALGLQGNNATLFAAQSAPQSPYTGILSDLTKSVVKEISKENKKTSLS